MRAALAAWLVLSLLGGTGAQGMCGDPPAAPSRSIPAPQLSPEERLSPHMPQSLRCDACHAIAFQKRLSGPGLPSQHPLSVLVSGGPWPAR
uniref:Uncharacterized protein n=1 Tax=Ficedula albicollis TaxID=59894 RepID=U3JK08_FICAL